MDKEVIEQIQDKNDTIVLYVDTTQVDKATEKVNQLKDLLLEVKDLINSLQVNSSIDIQEIAKELQKLSIRN